MSCELLAYCWFLFRACSIHSPASDHVYNVSHLSGRGGVPGIDSLRQGHTTTPLDIIEGWESLVKCPGEFTLGMCAYRLTSTQLCEQLLNTPWLLYVASSSTIIMVTSKGTEIPIFLLSCVAIAMQTSRHRVEPVDIPYYRLLKGFSLAVHNTSTLNTPDCSACSGLLVLTQPAALANTISRNDHKTNA